MAEKVDLSLDDIIKMNRQSSNNNQRGKKPNKPAKPNLQRLKNLGARSGIIRKGGPRQQNNNSNNRQQASVTLRKEPTRLHVSNLHFNVSNDDVRELFSEVGQLRKAVIHYDKSGRSLGTAEVIFATRDAAVRAIKKYNNLPLDGRPMIITMVPSQTSVRSPTKTRIGVQPGSGVQKRRNIKAPRAAPLAGNLNKGRVANTRGVKVNAQRKNQPKKQVTAEDLDADLEAYTMNVG